MSRPLIDPHDIQHDREGQASALHAETRPETAPRSCLDRRIQVTER